MANARADRDSCRRFAGYGMLRRRLSHCAGREFGAIRRLSGEHETRRRHADGRGDSVIGSAPVSGEATNCGILAGYEWPCQLLKFGWWDNQLLVYIAATPDGRGAVNSWSVRKG